MRAIAKSGWWTNHFTGPDCARVRRLCQSVKQLLGRRGVGLTPNPLFDTKWHAAQHEDVRATGKNPLLLPGLAASPDMIQPGLTPPVPQRAGERALNPLVAI